MLWAGSDGALEVRKSADGSTRLVGTFPYNSVAVLHDGGGLHGGRPRKEQFRSHAFAYTVADLKAEVNLLVGHELAKPLASRSAGTLILADSAEALTFEATISEEMSAVSWVKDVLAALAAGLMCGLSPGFRLPPRRVVPVAEIITQEEVDPARGMHGAAIRTVVEAILFELSVVTRAAYKIRLSRLGTGHQAKRPPSTRR